ncbi:hypothetical protein SAMN05216577_11511 [Pseudomonas citronellolis]|uniref:Uncharacterized protein n=1 Tax=Pseudomonas citronellolis TaxID=53408 RepID=A0AAQ1HNQ1_9PSED|nr:hypothetical protein [Pseudomonas citronellolis]MCP1605236.1 hypothetical protein [Pseudomonas citronellolis]MCP1656331.1 hypothetical protein [Pseudomonas citronellolis]MCP1723204.1 hypothetical protein [Pseudomonas citronellolis]UUC53288.1 hypothetical protein NOX82_15695 [Pseudomonas citronellolis]SFD03430.1 hypothetical protein SAMN05216577_11511 [Pseudomonas citronellolis]
MHCFFETKETGKLEKPERLLHRPFTIVREVEERQTKSTTAKQRKTLSGGAIVTKQ